MLTLIKHTQLNGYLSVRLWFAVWVWWSELPKPTRGRSTLRREDPSSTVRGASAKRTVTTLSLMSKVSVLMFKILIFVKNMLQFDYFSILRLNKPSWSTSPDFWHQMRTWLTCVECFSVPLCFASGVKLHDVNHPTLWRLTHRRKLVNLCTCSSATREHLDLSL